MLSIDMAVPTYPANWPKPIRASAEESFFWLGGLGRPNEWPSLTRSVYIIVLLAEARKTDGYLSLEYCTGEAPDTDERRKSKPLH